MRDFEIIMQGEYGALSGKMDGGPNALCCNGGCCNVGCCNTGCCDGACSDKVCGDPGDWACGDPMCDFDVGCDPNCGSEFAGSNVRRR